MFPELSNFLLCLLLLLPLDLLLFGLLNNNPGVVRWIRILLDLKESVDAVGVVVSAAERQNALGSVGRASNHEGRRVRSKLYAAALCLNLPL